MTTVIADRINRLLAEEPLSLTKAARMARVCWQTIQAWARDGVTSADGRTIRLEVFRKGQRNVTSVQALERFLLSIQPPEEVTPNA